jgi:hypothetical protein
MLIGNENGFVRGERRLECEAGYSPRYSDEVRNEISFTPVPLVLYASTAKCLGVRRASPLS